MTATKQVAAGRMSRRAMLAASGGALVLATTLGARAQQNLSGSVVYRERIALPPDAVVDVQLADVSRADAPAVTIASTRVRGAAGSPIAYSLTFDPAAIDPRARLALQARISVGDRLMFINTTHHAFDPAAGGPADIQVEMVARHAPAATPVGRWLAEDIGGGGVIDNLQSVIEIGADGRATGHAGCNRVNGQATIDGEALSFGPMMTTRMACAPAIMDQEQKFLRALEATRAFRLDVAQGKLLLLDAAGRQVMRLAAM